MEIFATRAPSYIAGPVIGLLIVALLWVANRPFGALGGYIEFVEWLTGRASSASWRVFFIGGIILGGLLSALVGGGLHPTLAYGSFDTLAGGSLLEKGLLLFGGGMLIGFGGRRAGGCTSGHGLCGTSFGSPASIVSTATFMATAIIATQVLVRMLGGAR